MSKRRRGFPSETQVKRGVRVVQAPDRDDILNIGGFSDAVFGVVAAFLAEDAGRFVAEVEAVEL